MHISETVLELMFWLAVTALLLVVLARLRRKVTVRRAQLNAGLERSFERHRSGLDDRAA